MTAGAPGHAGGAGPARVWLIDGNNVMGSRPDGWWNDRPAAMARLAQQVARWCWTHDDEVTLVFDGVERTPVARLAGGNLAIRFAPRPGRDGADDLIVDLAHDGAGSLVVVTADRGLIDRLVAVEAEAEIEIEGPRRFLDRLARS